MCKNHLTRTLNVRQATDEYIIMILSTQYFIKLSKAKQVLWCYFIWYLTMTALYFDPALHIWLTSIGVSSVIGIALMLSIANGNSAPPDFWTKVRLFMMPFCVSSFSALVKNHGFILVLSPRWTEDALAVVICMLFLAAVYICKAVANRSAQS